ncbi:Hypothetical protein R9X50_00799600 [Acrodontium crateriforme]|uniref:Uncharacterized protein n=1 Tax=Acrodontium crateriforme TaxID=150365 RepID=A0AAQ3MC52_9PEZI|nr:Hypothetical protein R9X50_00799600 [Acrodontium crateriforme]
MARKTVRQFFRNQMLKLMSKTTLKNRTIESLKLTAHSLLSDANNLEASVDALCARILEVPRPSTPPNREPIFQRPEGAPPSEYEKQVRAYNAMTEEFAKVSEQAKELSAKVTAFQNNVIDVSMQHKYVEKIGKTEHDLESLDNARRNLEKDMERVNGKLRAARETAVASAAKATA